MLTTFHKYKLDRRGFTLVELVIIIIVLGILAAVAIPQFADLGDSAKVTATQEEMRTIKRAIIGDPRVVAGGSLVNRGFEGDIGFPPEQLADLVARPGSLATYNKLTRLGWNGPYVDGSESSYLYDAWDVAYIYSPSLRFIRSVGGPDTLTVTF